MEYPAGALLPWARGAPITLSRRSTHKRKILKEREKQNEKIPFPKPLPHFGIKGRGSAIGSVPLMRYAIVLALALLN
jgi:hypothetical protein